MIRVKTVKTISIMFAIVVSKLPHTCAMPRLLAAPLPTPVPWLGIFTTALAALAAAGAQRRQQGKEVEAE